MAAICRRCAVAVCRNKEFSNRGCEGLSFSAPICTSARRSSSEQDRLWSSDFSSLQTKGFLRATKEYNPPPNVKELIVNICSELLGLKIASVDANVHLGDGTIRYKILTSCIEILQHDIPNYQLNKLTTVGDLVSYFERNVEARNPYDILCSRTRTNGLDALPPNLHVQADYVRFHPDTDTKFGGVSAFPLTSTIVTGLKYKKKYRGFKNETVLPNVE